MSVFCVALFDCNIIISFRISTFSTNEKLKLDVEVQFSLMAIILGCALYFTVALMTASLIFSDFLSVWFNCGMLRLVTILAKNSFKNLAVLLSLLMILSPSTIVIFSFEIILFDNNGLTTLQNFLLSQTFFSFKLLKYSLLLFHKSVTHKFLCLVYLFLFSSVLFLRKMFFRFVLSIIALYKFLFIKGKWLPLKYFFLRGAYWSKILLQHIKKSSTCWSQLFPKFYGKLFCNEFLKISLLKFL